MVVKSFHRIAKRYDCLYVHEEDNLGYRDHTHASGIYGMTKEEVLEWLRRLDWLVLFVIQIIFL